MTKKTWLLLLPFILSACSLNQTPKTMLPVNSSPSSMPTQSSYSNSSPLVAIKTKYGQILVKLYQQQAPNTVKNFSEKAKSGFYNGLTFHRVEPGFVVQGGDPLGTGTGGGKITSELNNLTFKRGSLGLARTPVIKEVSNDSQFYICLSDENCQQLTGDYVNFGEVVTGMEFVDQIKIGDKILEMTLTTK